MKTIIRWIRAKGAKQGSEARTYQTLARDPRATSDLLALWQSRPLKAIPEQAWNRKAVQEYQARSASADEAYKILLARVRLKMEQSGANWPACLVCPTFARLTFQDVLGCANAVQGFCPGTSHKVPCSEQETRTDIKPGPTYQFDDFWHDQRMNIDAMYERINARADKAVKATRRNKWLQNALYAVSGGHRRAVALSRHLSNSSAEMTLRRLSHVLRGQSAVPSQLRSSLKRKAGVSIPRSALLLSEAAMLAADRIRDMRRRQPGYVAGPSLETLIAQRDAREAARAAQVPSGKTESIHQSSSSPDSTPSTAN